MNKRLFQECLRIALKKLRFHQERFKHFSFILSGRQIFAMGKNRATRGSMHRVVANGYPIYSKIHAEFEAATRRSLPKNFDVLNIRLSAVGELRSAAPCKSCARVLKLLGCHWVYFTESNSILGRVRLN